MSQPLFTVLTPVYRTPLPLLEECIASVEAQTFEAWEMVLVDDGNDAELLGWLTDRCDSSTRLRVVSAPANLGIAGASQLGVQAARGEFLALLDHDDTLSPLALERMADALSASELVDYAYSDEDKIDGRGRFHDPFFKPDWSPERFRHQMYTCHLSVLRTSLVRAVGGFRAGFDGSQDYDLVLRVTEQAREVAHVPEVLYHWRAHAGSTAAIVDQKPAAYGASQRAVAGHCERMGIEADVMDGLGGTVRARRRVTGQPLVSLLIPTLAQRAEVRGREVTLLVQTIESIEATNTYDNIEYVVIGDTRMREATVSELRSLTTRPMTYIDYEQPALGFNFSNKINMGAAAAAGDYLVLVNDDLEFLTPGWVEELLGHAQQPDVGAVGGMYYFEDDTIQHAGVITTLGARHLFYKLPRGEAVYGNHLAVVRECSVLTAACLMVNRQRFVEVGGLTEALPNNFNDVDFCLKLRTNGYRNIWTPYVEAYHFESKSRVNRVQAFEEEHLRRRWGARLRWDPYYNPNLGLDPNWGVSPDWDQVTRGWPELVRDLDVVDPDGYLDVNPDLHMEQSANPHFDPLEHVRRIGRQERRLHVPRRTRPAADRNTLRAVRATPENFTAEGYLAANPDLEAVATAHPGWDALGHFMEHGMRERRFTYELGSEALTQPAAAAQPTGGKGGLAAALRRVTPGGAT